MVLPLAILLLGEKTRDERTQSEPGSALRSLLSQEVKGYNPTHATNR